MNNCEEVYHLIWDAIFKAAMSLKLKKTAKFLDVGCWDGELTQAVAKKTQLNTNNVYGIDVFDSILQKAKKRGIVTARVDLEKGKFPFEDNFFDLVLCNQVFEHLKNIYNPIDEIHRVLRKEGYLIFSVPNLSSFHNKIMLSLGFQPSSIRSIGPHIRGFTHREVKRFLELNGNFKVVKTYGVGFYPFPRGVASLLNKAFVSNSHTVVFVAKKVGDKDKWTDEVSKIEECSTDY